MSNGTAPRYCTLDALRDYLSNSGELGTWQDGLLTDCIKRAEAAIDAYTRRTFAAAPGTVYYSRYEGDRVRSQGFYLDKDLYRLDGVINGDGATIPVGSTWSEPRNEGPPFRIVRLKSSYVYTWNTDSDITFIGTWGYSLTPPDGIVQATIRYAAHLFHQKDVGVPPSDTAGFQEGGEVQYGSGMPNDVRWILAPYRSRTGGAY
jgi:hypothetical protein